MNVSAGSASASSLMAMLTVFAMESPAAKATLVVVDVKS
jgi:hypothetical protein